MHSTTAPSNLTGIAMMIVGMAFLSVNDALAKTLTQQYSPIQILFLRNLIALPVALIMARALGGASALRSGRPAVHFLRGALWVGATYMFFTSLTHLGLAEATALAFVAPLFITALSALLLRDPVGWRRWLAVLIGFAGVLIAIRPGTSSFQPAMLLPVGTAFLYALMMLSARLVDPRESVWTLLLWLTLTGTVLGGILTPLIWVPIRPGDLHLFLAIAFVGTAGVTLITQAFRLPPAVVLAPLDYTALIWATAFGWFIWSETPDTPTLIGASVIIGSGIFVIYRESRAATR
jgi:drug/metabolite transporter (DMT)-like permease